MLNDPLTEKIISHAYKVPNKLDFGFLENFTRALCLWISVTRSYPFRISGP